MVREIDSLEELELVISGYDTVVDFWAPWCGPCRLVAPVIDQIDKDFDVTVVKVNIDEVDVSKWDILSIPAIVRFKDGEESVRVVGAIPKAKILERLDLS